MLQFHLQLFVYWAFCREQTELMPKVSATSTWDGQNGGRSGKDDDDNNVFCQWRRRVCKQINKRILYYTMHTTWKNTKHKFDTHKQNRNNFRNVDEDVYGRLTAFHLLQKTATIVSILLRRNNINQQSGTSFFETDFWFRISMKCWKLVRFDRWMRNNMGRYDFCARFVFIFRASIVVIAKPK